MSEPLVRLQGVSRHYGALRALDGTLIEQRFDALTQGRLG